MVNWSDIAKSVLACVDYLRMIWRPTVWDAVVMEGMRLAQVFPHISLDRVLASGAPVDALGGKDFLTPFQQAIRTCNYVAARKLLKAGAKVDAKSLYGSTALHDTLCRQPQRGKKQARQRQQVCFLLENGASAKMAGGALLYSGNPMLVAPLVAAGLDVSGMCVSSALMSGDEPMLDAMLHVVPNPKKIKSRLLQLAITNGDEESVKRLVVRDVEVGMRGNSPYAPLHAAVRARKINIVEILIILGADVNAKVLDDKGNTVLHEAAQTGNSAIVAMLMAHGADPKAMNNHGIPAQAYIEQFGVEIEPHNLTRAKMDLATKRRDILRPGPAM